MNMPKLRKKVYHLLEARQRAGSLSNRIDIFLFSLIAINIAAVVMATEPWFANKHRGLLIAIEFFSVAVFTIEYVLRVWVSVENPKFQDARFPRLRYMMTPMALVDLIAIAPIYLIYFVEIDLRFVWALRLIRIVKFTRYSAALSMLQDVFREEASTFYAGFFILMVMLTIAGSGAYMAEHMAQPDAFGSIPEAMWWAMATLTTVGYGDVTPVTPLGKVFGSLVAVVGIGMAALPAGILANGLAQRMHQARDELLDNYRHALEDGVIDSQEREALEDLRKELGLSKRDADRIQAQVRRDHEKGRLCHCPKCGHIFAPSQHQA